jgi:hypothetical protein
VLVLKLLVLSEGPRAEPKLLRRIKSLTIAGISDIRRAVAESDGDEAKAFDILANAGFEIRRTVDAALSLSMTHFKQALQQAGQAEFQSGGGELWLNFSRGKHLFQGGLMHGQYCMWLTLAGIDPDADDQQVARAIETINRGFESPFCFEERDCCFMFSLTLQLDAPLAELTDALQYMFTLPDKTGLWGPAIDFVLQAQDQRNSGTAR